jgi:hypothetical protein
VPAMKNGGKSVLAAERIFGYGSTPKRHGWDGDETIGRIGKGESQERNGASSG